MYKNDSLEIDKPLKLFKSMKSSLISLEQFPEKFL